MNIAAHGIYNGKMTFLKRKGEREERGRKKKKSWSLYDKQKQLLKKSKWALIYETTELVVFLI